MWIYNNAEFTDDMIPEGAVGFVYEMVAVIEGKVCRYILDFLKSKNNLSSLFLRCFFVCKCFNNDFFDIIEPQ